MCVSNVGIDHCAFNGGVTQQLLNDRTSVPSSNRWAAKLCLSVCRVAFFLISHFPIATKQNFSQACG